MLSGVIIAFSLLVWLFSETSLQPQVSQNQLAGHYAEHTSRIMVPRAWLLPAREASHLQ